MSARCTGVVSAQEGWAFRAAPMAALTSRPLDRATRHSSLPLWGDSLPKVACETAEASVPFIQLRTVLGMILSFIFVRLSILNLDDGA
jgi:hypothetical protein